MGAKKTKKPAAAANNGGIVVSKSVHRDWFGNVPWLKKLPLKLRFVTVLGVLVLVLAVGSYFYYKRDNVAPPPYANLSNTSDDYSSMTPAQLDYYLYQKTGLTVEYLNTKSLNGRVLNTYTKAYDVARVYYQLGDKQKALKAYAVAASKHSSDKTYAFYESYAIAALQSGDKVTWKKEMEIALNDAKNDKTLDSDTKARVVNDINHMLSRAESV